jgi:hypothetical protein
MRRVCVCVRVCACVRVCVCVCVRMQLHVKRLRLPWMAGIFGIHLCTPHKKKKLHSTCRMKTAGTLGSTLAIYYRINLTINSKINLTSNLTFNLINTLIID